MTYASKLQKVVTMYIKKCTDEPAFINGKPSRQYWQVRGFFFKQDPDIVNIVFDFLDKKQDKTFLSLYNVIKSAKSMQTELRWEEAKEQVIRKLDKADPYSFDMLMNM